MFRRDVTMIILALALVAGLGLARGAMAGQASSYVETGLVEGQCEQFLFDNATACGFSDVSLKAPSIEFRSGPYECGARCVTKHGIVFMYCTGPSSEQAHQIVEQLKKTGHWLQ